MDTFQIKEFNIKIDIEKNKTIYKQLKGLNCTCLTCQNFTAAIHLLPESVTNIFKTLGIEPGKSDEAWEASLENSKHFYQAIYYFVGEVIQGDGEWYAMDQYKIQFWTGVHGPQPRSVFNKHKPLSTFTINTADFPWVLKEKTKMELKLR